MVDELSEPRFVSFTELALGFGQQMLLLQHPKDKDSAFPCELVGCLAEQSLLVGPPASGLLPRLEEGQRLVAQVKLAGGVAVFQTTVLYVSDIPTVLVFLDYPVEVKFKRVRADLRVNVALPVLVINKTTGAGRSHAGKIVDISISGARLEMFEALGAVGHEIELKGKFHVGAIERLLCIDAVIRAQTSRHGQRLYGIEFRSGDEEKLLVLMGYTFHAMALGHLQSIR